MTLAIMHQSLLPIRSTSRDSFLSSSSFHGSEMILRPLLCRMLPRTPLVSLAFSSSMVPSVFGGVVLDGIGTILLHPKNLKEGEKT